MSTALLQDQSAFFGREEGEPVAAKAKKPTRRFEPALPKAKLKLVPATEPVARTRLRFTPMAQKKVRVEAPREPESMMRFGAVGVAALAVAGFVLVATSNPVAARIAPERAPDVQVDVELAAELPAPEPVVATPVVAPATTSRRASGVTTMARAPRETAAEANVDEITDEPALVIPVDGPRPNPF
jgi:hypothetical protein